MNVSKQPLTTREGGPSADRYARKFGHLKPGDSHIAILNNDIKVNGKTVISSTATPSGAGTVELSRNQIVTTDNMSCTASGKKAAIAIGDARTEEGNRFHLGGQLAVTSVSLQGVQTEVYPASRVPAGQSIPLNGNSAAGVNVQLGASTYADHGCTAGTEISQSGNAYLNQTRENRSGILGRLGVKKA